MISPNENNGTPAEQPHIQTKHTASFTFEMSKEDCANLLKLFEGMPMGPGPYGRGDEPT